VAEPDTALDATRIPNPQRTVLIIPSFLIIMIPNIRVRVAPAPWA
jgi:hypothetical protein